MSLLQIPVRLSVKSTTIDLKTAISAATATVIGALGLNDEVQTRIVSLILQYNFDYPFLGVHVSSSLKNAFVAVQEIPRGHSWRPLSVKMLQSFCLRI